MTVDNECRRLFQRDVLDEVLAIDKVNTFRTDRQTVNEIPTNDRTATFEVDIRPTIDDISSASKMEPATSLKLPRDHRAPSIALEPLRHAQCDRGCQRVQ